MLEISSATAGVSRSANAAAKSEDSNKVGLVSEAACGIEGRSGIRERF
jgi:hypothetical protein